LTSIQEQSYKNIEIIVVDNNSGKDSQDLLSEIEGEVKVVRNDKNLYWSAACNKGVQAADKNSKYYIFLHCDVVVLNPAWMDLLINVSEAQQSGFVGIDTQSYMLGNNKVDFLQDYIILVTKEAWKDIGPWPETLPMVGGSFILTMKAQQKGHKPQIMKNPIVHHYRVFSLDINEFERMTEQAMVEIPKLMSDVQSRAL
jgi:GT2 family glycosyltransferase